MPRNLLLAALALGSAAASAQSTYTTNTGTVNLVAGLTTLTDTSAVNPAATATDLGYITDSNWSTTGIINLGTNNGAFPNGGSLAGTFGGGTYHAASNSIILIGMCSIPSGSWGTFEISLLLSNGQYSSSIGYTNADINVNTAVKTGSNSTYFSSSGGITVQNNSNYDNLNTGYIVLSIADFDVSDIGVTGIKIFNAGGEFGTARWPDLNYIGVTGPSAPVPEPSTYGLALGGLALAVVAARRRRKISK